MSRSCSSARAPRLPRVQDRYSPGLRYQLTPAIDVEAGYCFTYFAQHEVSREDGNSIRLWDNGLSALLAYRF